MVEIAYYSPKTGTRLVLAVGHGSPTRGQSYIATLIREDIDAAGQVEYARCLWVFPRRIHIKPNAPLTGSKQPEKGSA